MVLFYHEVVNKKNDTLRNTYKNNQISEIYYNKQFAVIAFYDRKTHDWYYRK